MRKPFNLAATDFAMISILLDWILWYMVLSQMGKFLIGIFEVGLVCWNSGRLSLANGYQIAKNGARVLCESSWE